MAMEYPTSSPPVKCPQDGCQKVFPSTKALEKHMTDEFRGSKWSHHLHCQDCYKYYTALELLHGHTRRYHPRDQNLVCPGCKKHFVRAADLVRHYEQNQCPSMSKAQLDEKREKRMRFAHGLQARHLGDYDAEIEAQYMSHNSALRPKADATVRPYPVQLIVHESDRIDPVKYYQMKREAHEAKQIEASKQELNSTEQASDGSEQAVHGSMQGDEDFSQVLKASPQKPQLSGDQSAKQHTCHTPQHKSQKATSPLLEDFDPDDLKSIKDFEGSCYPGSPRSVWFNPWDKEDDLICFSSHASTRPPTPDYSPVSAARVGSPAPSKAPSSSASTIIVPAAAVVGQDNGAVPTKTSQPAPPARGPSPTSTTMTSSGRFSGPANQYGYQPFKLMPRKNYDHYVSLAKASNSGMTPAQSTSTSVRPEISQMSTPNKNSSAAVMPGQPSSTPEPVKISQTPALSTPFDDSVTHIQHRPAAEQDKSIQAPVPAKFHAQALVSTQNRSAPEPAKASQALTPVRPPGALAPLPNNGSSPAVDYDAVNQELDDIFAQHNPRNRHFNVQRYYVRASGKYKCPMPECFESFKKPGQLEAHLPKHQKAKKFEYECPGCHDRFETIAALIAHTESQSIRCHFRNSKNYGHFLAQALVGIVDVVGEDVEHGLVEFAISKEAKQIFGGGPAPYNRETRRSRSDEFKAATAAIDDRAFDDDDEEKRKFWEDHERQIEAEKAKEAERLRTLQAKKEQDMLMLRQDAHETNVVTVRQLHERHGLEAQWERDREVRAEQTRRTQEQRAREAEQQQAMARAKMEQERKFQQQKAREAADEQERIRRVRMEEERNLHQQKAREAAAEQERLTAAGNTQQNRYVQGHNVSQAELEHIRRAQYEEESRRIKEQARRDKEEERAKRVEILKKLALQKPPSSQAKTAPSSQARKAPVDLTKIDQDCKTKQATDQRMIQCQQSVQITANTSATPQEDDLLEEEERNLLARLEKIREQRWKCQQENEKKAIEEARQEQQARQAGNGAGYQQTQHLRQSNNYGQQSQQTRRADNGGDQQAEQYAPLVERNDPRFNW
ncbi:hypothetical protein GE09DRAFT_1219629 [Coniochaeta sp. 2T2.1]|nr:hypothetical protein GE09DRAFT_1219629 [Coniochaeta sp. 2T2.1]